MESALLLSGVTKTFGGMRAVDRLDLEVPRGSLCGVIGPNGAGK
jgi:ABC-type branched-subunit amino acid transport system ATPase component